MFHEHLSSHLDTAAPALGADPGTPNPLTPAEPLNPAPVLASTPLFSLQHILIIGGVAALIYYLLSKNARKPKKD